MKRKTLSSQFGQLTITIFLSILISSCGGGNSKDPLPIEVEETSTGVKFAVKAPTNFQNAFCVSIHVSGADFTTIIDETVYPPKTEIIEAVIPNIPIGSDRTVEMGIFESGKCGAPTDAEWYASTSGVEILDSEVTIVNLGLLNPKKDGIGSVVIRGDRSKQIIRLHGEVISEKVVPIAGAGCRIFEGVDLIGNVSSGNTTTDLGVLDTDVTVNANTNQLILQCQRPGFQNTTKVAQRITDPSDPTSTTFVATVVMKSGVSLSVVESSPELLIVEAKLPEFQLQSVDTPSGQFQRIANNEKSLILTGGGVNNFSQAEIPILTMHVAFPIDATDVGPESVVVERIGSSSTVDARLYPIQRPASEVVKFFRTST